MFQKLGLGNTWVTEQSNVDFTSDSQVVFSLCSHTSCHLQQKGLFHSLHTINFRCNTFRQVIDQFIWVHASMNILNTFSHLFTHIYINVFFLFPYNLRHINVRVEIQLFLHEIFGQLSWQYDTLDLDDISWLSVVHEVPSQLQMYRFWNRSPLQLLRSLLHF